MDIQRINKRLLDLDEEREQENEKGKQTLPRFKIKDEIPKYVPTNAEISFLEKISFKKVEHLDVIAKDFGLNKKDIEKLIEKKVLSTKEGLLYSHYRERPELILARAWMNLKKEEDRSLLPTPKQENIKIVEGKTVPIPLKIQAIDYFVTLKSLRNEQLTTKEQKRANELLRNGTIPHGPDQLSLLKQKQKSWKLSSAKNKALSQHFTKTHDLDIEAIKFVNLFKQVTPQQLASILGDPSAVSKYTDNLDPEKKMTTSSKILKKQTMISINGSITYLSINHLGDFNGRKILEQHIPKAEINTHAQRRNDLRNHDLKVVDSLLLVQKELKEQGYTIKNILNESAQFSKEKAGKQNFERQNGPSYMDVLIEVEKRDPETGQTRTEKIAVEYGNYSLSRMQSKIDNSSFDKAVIFSDNSYVAKYQKNINTNKNVIFRSL